eukprot:gene441-467_t
MSLESDSNAPFRGPSDQELQLVNKYLTAGFGPPNSIPSHTSNTSFAETKPASEKVTYFGAYAAKEQQERNSTLYRILEATPLLQGPFHGSLPSKSNSNRHTRTPIDLSIYGQVSDLLLCPHHHCSAPVVAVSYGGGGVLLLLLDGEIHPRWKDHHPAFSSLSISSSPSGSATCESCLLALVEFVPPAHMPTPSPAARDRQGQDTVTCGGRSRLTWDPVLPQVVLVTVASPAAVLLVRFPWIETFLTASTNPSLKDYPAAPAPPTSSTLVFYPTVIATMQPCTLVGMCVTAQSSVHLGRMAVTRMSTGLLAVIDLSLYEQLYTWTQRVQKQAEENSTDPRQGLGGESPALLAATQQYIKDAKEALLRVPKPSSAGLKPFESSAVIDSFMDTTKDYIEKRVLYPMQEVQRRTLTRLEIIKDTISYQMSRIQSSDSDSSSGLKGKISAIEQRQLVVEERLQRLQESTGRRKLFVSSCMSSAMSTRPTVSKAERKYYEELKVWQDQAVELEKNVAMLKREFKRQVRSNGGGLVSPGDTMAASNQSSPIFLRSSGGVRAQSREGSGLGFGSPGNHMTAHMTSRETNSGPSAQNASLPFGSPGASTDAAQASLQERPPFSSPAPSSAQKGRRGGSAAEMTLSDEDLQELIALMKSQAASLQRVKDELEAVEARLYSVQSALSS